MSTSLVFDELEAFQHEEGEVDQSCMITEITGDVVSGARLSLSCTDAMDQLALHTVDIAATPTIDLPVEVGMQVQLYVFVFLPGSWGDLYVTLRDDEGRLLLGYMSAGGPFSGCCGVQPDPTMFAPVDVTLVSDVCAPDCPPEEETSAGFIINPCPCQVRKAFDFTTDDDTTRVYDRGTGVVGTTEAFVLRVDRAAHWTNLDDGNCHSTGPGGWYELLITRLP